MLCQYKNILGKVGEGVHSYRIANLAVVDILLTILLAFFIHLMLPAYHFGYILLAVFLLGIVLHRIFCVKTTIDKWIFG
jgi:hypothetical protein